MRIAFEVRAEHKWETTGVGSNGNDSVSIVVLTRNSVQTIESCMSSIVLEGPLEVIVVDILPTDEMRSIVERYGAKILPNRSNSLGYSRQLGAKSAKGEFVMFVDSDVELVTGCIAHLRSALDKYGWAGIHASVLSWENASQPSWTRFVNKRYDHDNSP